MTLTDRSRSVLITGASTGIGRAAAKMFAEAGDRVWAVARSKEKLEDLAAEHGGPPTIVPLPADVGEISQMEALTSTILAKLGVPDVIVANAALGLDALFENTPDEDFERILQVNVMGVVRTIQPFIQPMAKRGSGRILIVSSIVGRRAVPYYSAYCASKYALDGIADALRPELRGTGITVGVVYPASTVTEFHDRKLHHGPRQKRYRVTRHTPGSVARAIVRMSRSRRKYAVLTFEGKMVTLLNAVAPGLLDRVLARMFPRRES